MKTTETRTPKRGFTAGLKQIACSLLMTALLGACNEKHDPDAVPALSISPAKDALSFSARAIEEYTFEVNTNQPVWFVVSDQPWCKVEMDAKAGTFTVSAEENNATTAPAPATIIVSAGRAGELKIAVTQEAAVYDLYICGSYTDEVEGEIPCYWKNDAKTDLPIPAERYQGSASGIAAATGSVYIAGTLDNQACYWKDGVYVELKDPTPEGGSAPFYPAIAIAVDNEDLYVLSSEYYWKNDEQPYNIARQGFKGYDIAASDGSFCIPGSIIFTLGNVGEVASMHSNCGASLSGIPDSKDSRGTAATFSGGSIYVGGHYFDKIANRVQACSWKDGQYSLLETPQETTETSVRSIAVADGKVYASGYCSDGTYSTPCYWVDGKYYALPLPYQTSWASAADIAVVNGNVYIAGEYKEATDWEYYGCYWLNGKRVDLKKEAGVLNLSATGIAVVKR